MGCKRYVGCIPCVLFQISWHLQTQIVMNRTLNDSLLGTKGIVILGPDLFGEPTRVLIFHSPGSDEFSQF